MLSVAFFLLSFAPTPTPGLPLQAPGVSVERPDPPRPEQNRADSTSTVRGVITRAGTGEPIVRAAIRLTPVFDTNDPTAASAALAAGNQPPTAATDAGGNFVLEGLEPGEYRISATRNGFVRQEYGQREPGTPGTPVELIAGQEFEASFQMLPAATIAGRIYDEFGEPVPYAEVSAMQTRVGPDGQENVVPVQSDSTNDRGEYRLFWLTPGQYVVSAQVSNNRLGTFIILGGTGFGGVNSNAETQARQMSAFYPSVPDAAQAAPIVLSPGDELVGIDIRLLRKQAFTISGRIITTTQLIGTGMVSLRPSNPASGGFSLFNSSPTDAEGNFTITDVAPGSYTLQSQAQGIAGRRLAASVEVEVTNRDIENVALTMSAGVDITGRIFVEDARGSAAAEALSGLNIGQLRVMLRGDNAIGAALGQPTDGEGGFRMEGVAPGEYAVSFSVPGQLLYLKRVLLGSEEVAPGDPITIPPGFDGQLNLLASPNGGRINGVASDEDDVPIANATVTLLPVEMPEPTGPNSVPPGLVAGLKTSRTGRNGEYSLTGIAPGEYRLFAWESTQPVPFMNQTFMRRFEARAERVSIQEGDELNVGLDVIPENETQ